MKAAPGSKPARPGCCRRPEGLAAGRPPAQALAADSQRSCRPWQKVLARYTVAKQVPDWLCRWTK